MKMTHCHKDYIAYIKGLLSKELIIIDSEIQTLIDNYDESNSIKNTMEMDIAKSTGDDPHAIFKKYKIDTEAL